MRHIVTMEPISLCSLTKALHHYYGTYSMITKISLSVIPIITELFTEIE